VCRSKLKNDGKSETRDDGHLPTLESEITNQTGVSFDHQHTSRLTTEAANIPWLEKRCVDWVQRRSGDDVSRSTMNQANLLGENQSI